MNLIFVALATAIGGLVVYFATRPGGVADQIASGLRTTDNYNEADFQGSVEVAGHSIGSSPYQSKSNISTGIGLASTINSAGMSGALGSTIAASAAVPIIGVALAGAAAVWGLIAAQHQKAVALEASVLNDAVPNFRQTMTILASAAVQRKITSQQLNAVLDQAIQDYYSRVSKIIKGKWPASVPTQPSTCNGPCVVGHWWIESDANSMRQLVNDINAGHHGQLKFDTVPSHAGFQGAPSITINF